MYFIRWVTGGHFTRGFYCINLPVEAYTRGVGAGRTISKRTPHSLDREDRQDFVIRCRTYSNSPDSDLGIAGRLRINRDSVYQYRLDPRSVIELLIQ